MVGILFVGFNLSDNDKMVRDRARDYVVFVNGID